MEAWNIQRFPPATRPGRGSTWAPTQHLARDFLHENRGRSVGSEIHQSITKNLWGNGYFKDILRFYHPNQILVLFRYYSKWIFVRLCIKTLKSPDFHTTKKGGKLMFIPQKLSDWYWPKLSHRALLVGNGNTRRKNICIYIYMYPLRFAKRPLQCLPFQRF